MMSRDDVAIYDSVGHPPNLRDIVNADVAPPKRNGIDRQV